MLLETESLEDLLQELIELNKENLRALSKEKKQTDRHHDALKSVFLELITKSIIVDFDNWNLVYSVESVDYIPDHQHFEKLYYYDFHHKNALGSLLLKFRPIFAAHNRKVKAIRILVTHQRVEKRSFLTEVVYETSELARLARVVNYLKRYRRKKRTNSELLDIFEIVASTPKISANNLTIEELLTHSSEVVRAIVLRVWNEAKKS